MGRGAAAGRLEMLGFQFRFRGKTKRILAIYACFREHPGDALHPTQIARLTGIPMLDVVRQLDSVHELFVKMPKRDGITRYRITTTSSMLGEEEVEKLVLKRAQRETWLFYAFIIASLLGFVVAVMSIAPAI